MKSDKLPFFDRIETFYLSALRKTLLVISTGLFIYAAFVGLGSLYKITRSTDVKEDPVNITSADIIPQKPTATSTSTAATGPDHEGESQTAIWNKHVTQMASLWRSKFENNRKPSDPALAEADFRQWYEQTFGTFNTPDWCQGEEDCSGNPVAAAEFKADLDLAVATITTAAVDADITGRMSAYRAGTSTSPEDSYDNVFTALNRNFWHKLTSERAAKAQAAEAKRAELAAGKVAGTIGLATAGWAFGAFLTLMFSFLLVAVERHQRKMAKDIEEIKTGLEK